MQSSEEREPYQSGKVVPAFTTDASSSRHSASKHGRQELFQYWISFSTAPPRFLLLKNGFNVDTSEIWDSI